MDPTLLHIRDLSSSSREDSENEEEEDYVSDESEEENEDTVSDIKREYSPEEKEVEAAAIGYKVIGSLLPSDLIFKPHEPLFAVVQAHHWILFYF